MLEELTHICCNKINGYQIDSIVNSLPETKYLFHGFFKNDTISFELQLKRNVFFIVYITVKISLWDIRFYILHW